MNRGGSVDVDFSKNEETTLFSVLPIDSCSLSPLFSSQVTINNEEVINTWSYKNFKLNRIAEGTETTLTCASILLEYNTEVFIIEVLPDVLWDKLYKNN
jgi:hypothetical protein